MKGRESTQVYFYPDMIPFCMKAKAVSAAGFVEVILLFVFLNGSGGSRVGPRELVR